MTRGFLRPIAALAVAGAAALFIGSALSASAAVPPVGSFPVWTQTTPTTFSGALTDAAGGGVIAVSTDATSPRIAETGQQAFLGAQTGFGMRFGTSRYQSYLTIGTAAGATPSTTVITLPALPIGWGFAVGDIDADMVTIAATGPGGPLMPAEIGPQDTGGTPFLNYCRAASPKPSGCGSGTTFDDFPFWCPDATAGAACAGLPEYPTVLGHGVDTSGAYDWFVPTVPVETLTLRFRPQLGIPTFQLWIVVPAPAAQVSGLVELANGDPAPSGTLIAVLDSAAEPIRDLEDQPVMVPVDADGTYQFTTELGEYDLRVIPPDGFEAEGAIPITVSGDAVTVPPLRIAAVPAPVAAPATGPADELPATGADPALVALGGMMLLGCGLMFVVESRRVRPVRCRAPRAARSQRARRR